jgi:hypothetical protein
MTMLRLEEYARRMGFSLETWWKERDRMADLIDYAEEQYCQSCTGGCCEPETKARSWLRDVAAVKAALTEAHAILTETFGPDESERKKDYVEPASAAERLDQDLEIAMMRADDLVRRLRRAARRF